MQPSDWQREGECGRQGGVTRRWCPGPGWPRKSCVPAGWPQSSWLQGVGGSGRWAVRRSGGAPTPAGSGLWGMTSPGRAEASAEGAGEASQLGRGGTWVLPDVSGALADRRGKAAPRARAPDQVGTETQAPGSGVPGAGQGPGPLCRERSIHPGAPSMQKFSGRHAWNLLEHCPLKSHSNNSDVHRQTESEPGSAPELRIARCHAAGVSALVRAGSHGDAGARL